MKEVGKITWATKAKAFVCRLCPLCRAARRWPNSRYAQRIRVVTKDCPFCKAYIRLQRARVEAVKPSV